MIIEILILLLGIPLGLILAWSTKEELVSGRKWFRILIIGFGMLGVWFYLTGFGVGAWSSFFVVIVSFVCYWKSYDKKWIR